MRPADTWQEYELIDATNHNRLERWGDTLLIRPDPQIIWKNEPVSPLWNRADAIYHRSARGGGQWEQRRKLPARWRIGWPAGSPRSARTAPSTTCARTARPR